MGMKQILVIMATAVLVGCEKPEVRKLLSKEESAKVIETAVREQLKKPVGTLTKADFDKVVTLKLGDKQLTDVTELEKLTRLQIVDLYFNPDLTKDQIDQLQKALPNCKIGSPHSSP